MLDFPNLTDDEERAIRRFLNEFDEIAVSDAIVERTIQIRKSARIKIPDALIAASADIVQGVVVTRNTSDFQRVPGLTVMHPDEV
ncbi:MAG: PIN domain-containing protein [Chthoniobacteraceae bacterium]